jgi:hypothetical protein
MSDDGIVVYTEDLQPVKVDKDNKAYERVKQHLINGDYEEAVIAASPKQVIINTGVARVEGTKVFLGDKEVHNSISRRILDMVAQGFTNVDNLLHFMENLEANPSNTAQKELYLFLEDNDLPITDDGHILAYKAVDENFKDCYTGKMDNSVGATVEMERKDVDDRRNVTCSHGLHFASYHYAVHVYGGARIVAVKINPRDVVSIPNDYNNQKGRCCKYVVVKDLTKEAKEDDYNILEDTEKNYQIEIPVETKEKAPSWMTGHSTPEDDCDPEF